MTSKTKPTVSAAIDADNDITSPLDFSYKCLAGIQGLFWYSIRYCPLTTTVAFFSFYQGANIFVIVFLTFYRCYGRRAESRSSQIYPRGGICRSSQLLQFLRRSPFPHWGSGGGGGGVFYRSPNAKRLRSLVIRVRKLIDSLINVVPPGGDHRLGWGGDQT